MNDFGAAARRLMSERGLSQNKLAGLAHWNAGYLSKVLNGRKPGTHALAADLDRALGANGELLDVWAASHGSPSLAALAAPAQPVDLPHAAAGTLTRWDAVHEPAAVSVLAPGQAWPGEISHLEDAAAMFRTWDHQRGGGLGRQAAIGQLADVTELIGRPHPAPLRRRLLSVASMLTLTIASMSADTGDTSTAYRYLWTALEAAREARNPELGARAANAIARRMLDDGDQQGALGLLRHARASLRGLPGEMTALLATSEAWTCAASGDYQQMAPCLNLAAESAGDSGSLFGPAELAGISGACYEALATRPGPVQTRYAALAEQYISDALRLREPFYARSRALDLVGLANVRLCQGEPAEAVRVAGDALDTAARLRSGRAARRVHSLAIRALGDYPRVPEVEQFADAVRSRLPVA
jgi:transcriptional regulator with XRE-family HTH domain